MDFFHSPLAARIIFVTAVTNAVLLVLVLASCRCVPTMSLGKGLMRNPAYKRFYKYHCLLWWPLWASIIVHIVFALSFAGIPF